MLSYVQQLKIRQRNHLFGFSKVIPWIAVEWRGIRNDVKLLKKFWSGVSETAELKSLDLAYQKFGSGT